VEQLCDEVAFLDHGKVVEAGKVEELLQKYAIPSVYIKGSGPLLNDITMFGDIEHKNGGFLIKTEQPMSIMEQIIEMARHQKWEIERLELVKPRLENVFMDLTGSALRN